MAEQNTLLDQWGRPIEQRSSNLTYPEAWLIDALGGAKSTAGERVNTKTAITVMAFFACVRNIAEDLTKLPKRIMRTTGRESNALPEHPVSRLLKYPSRYFDRHTFWLTYIAQALSHEGAYAYIVRDQQTGAPMELLMLDPERCEPFASEITGEPMIRAYGNVLFGWEVLHLRGLGDLGIKGYSATDIARQVIGAAIAMQKMRGSFFGNGMIPSGIIKHPTVLTNEAKQALAKNFRDNYTGSDKGFSIIMLEEGFEFQQVSIDPEKADFASLNEISVIDICRLFRMPPHKIQSLENAHYANVEELNLDYKGDTIDPWADRLRSEVEFKLLTRRERDAGLFCDINLKALERGNLAARKEFYNFMYYSGAMSANDILEKEHENPVQNGDRYFVQANLVPADRVDDSLDKKTTAPGPAGPAPQPTQPSPADTFRRMLQAKIADLLREDLRRIDSVGNKAFNWTDWYSRRENTVCEHLTPFMMPLCEWFNSVTPASVMAAGLAARMCSDSLILLEADEFTDWRGGTRAIDLAQSVMDALQEEYSEATA